jgi:cellulose synthase/poly-beta-1,6-N-acetylglucosamine synthase-like glycosyltransferase
MFFWYRFLRNRKKLIDRSALPSIHSPFIIFQVTTKGGCVMVNDIIQRVRDVCAAAGFHTYRIDVVTDNPTDQYDAEIIRVPASFQTLHRSKYKARALHYNVLRLIQRGENKPDNWILHLDEESFIIPQTLASVLKYISSENPAPISEGPIFFPNKMFEGAYLSRFFEAMRPFVCYDCITQMTKHGVPIHMHGSNLLVRADVECLVGWDYGTVASEDQRFGFESYLLLGKKIDPLFGWHGGVIQEQPPLNLRGFVGQRQRWLIGNIQNLRTSRVPKIDKLKIIARWGVWVAGLPSGVISILGLIILQNTPNLFVPVFQVSAVLWALSYQEGLRLNLAAVKTSKLRKLSLHLQLVALCPFLGLIETLAVFTAPLKMRKWTWVPTEKSVNHEKLPNLRQGNIT